METTLLTKENAHRVTMVRRKDEPGSEPVPFKYRGKREFGIGNFYHLVGEAKAERILPKNEFTEWEVVEFAHPGYLEEYWETACRAHSWNSDDPDLRGEDNIASYEKELHEDLMSMPEEEHSRYLDSYKHHLLAVWAAKSRVASAAVTGPTGFNSRRNDKAERTYYNRNQEFRGWRERVLTAVKKRQKIQKNQEERMDEEWQKVQEDINHTAETIRNIDSGVECGYNRSLFVSNLFGRIATHANKGNVEIVDKAIALVREWNAKCKKDIITGRHSFFKLPEIARKIRQQAEVNANRENKEVTFEGGRLVWNYAEERLQMFFNDKPDEETRHKLHREFRFNWSGKNMAWQRQLTRNAVEAARQFLNIELESTGITPKQGDNYPFPREQSES